MKTSTDPRYQAFYDLVVRNDGLAHQMRFTREVRGHYVPLQVIIDATRTAFAIEATLSVPVPPQLRVVGLELVRRFNEDAASQQPGEPTIPQRALLHRSDGNLIVCSMHLFENVRDEIDFDLETRILATETLKLIRQIDLAALGLDVSKAEIIADEEFSDEQPPLVRFRPFD